MYRIDFARPLNREDAVELMNEHRLDKINVLSKTMGLIYSFPKGTLFKSEFSDSKIYDIEDVTEAPRPWRGYEYLFESVQSSLVMPEMADLYAVKGEVIIKCVINPMGQVIYANIEKRYWRCG